MDMRAELNKLRAEYAGGRELITDPHMGEKYDKLLEENKSLPSDIQRVESSGYRTYFKVPQVELSNEELQELFAYKNHRNIKIIKNCAIFFAVLTAISLIVSAIGIIKLVSLFSNF